MSERLEHRLIVGALCGVGQDRYEEWRDSMSDEYYAILLERLGDQKLSRTLLRATL